MVDRATAARAVHFAYFDFTLVHLYFSRKKNIIELESILRVCMKQIINKWQSDDDIIYNFIHSVFFLIYPIERMRASVGQHRNSFCNFSWTP